MVYVRTSALERDEDTRRLPTTHETVSTFPRDAAVAVVWATSNEVYKRCGVLQPTDHTTVIHVKDGNLWYVCIRLKGC